jgi:hypothetical protein
MEVTPSGMIMLVNRFSRNALFPIAVTGMPLIFAGMTSLPVFLSQPVMVIVFPALPSIITRNSNERDDSVARQSHAYQQSYKRKMFPKNPTPSSKFGAD